MQLSAFQSVFKTTPQILLSNPALNDAESWPLFETVPVPSQSKQRRPNTASLDHIKIRKNALGWKCIKNQIYQGQAISQGTQSQLFLSAQRIMIITHPCRLPALLWKPVMLECNTVLGTATSLTGDVVGRYFVLANHSMQHGLDGMLSTSTVGVNFSINDTFVFDTDFILSITKMQQGTACGVS
jgi:hypothetical protein